MTEFLFIRHGETDWNRQQRFQGRIDVPLNATGRLQAERLAERLAPEPVDALYASDLVRAMQTAQPLARAWKLDTRPEPGLREQGFGILEGLDVPTIRVEHADLWARWIERRADFALPGGESVRDFSTRVLGAVARLAAAHEGGRVAVVTHGGVLDMLWRHARGEALDGARACLIPNTGLNRLRWHDGALTIEAWGDDAHIADLPGTAPVTPLAR
ncbi:histidine phosphatase family protein [Rubrivivax gelatinosus]|uniref:Putative phosphoglycerate mutase GpmB n=1 Tax=Rubrivivax gelatinosus (strain NBRC 100245 / IL144) TaxID=983917 RepID=I0HY71_RUBGI|nr:histidine phosphatase family protein [Rubrivivax gelatinosus]BAL97958.1 putative phosphoglycerate mutase GpmB [Rubrivivax gelatinosus IL144]